VSRPRHFCAWCGGLLGDRDAEGAQTCRRCGEKLYANAAPCVAVLVLDADDRVLLARRGRDPGKGGWDLPGGFVDETEVPEDAVHREIAEETGLEVRLGAFLGHVVDRYGEDGDETLNCVYVARLASGSPTAADDVAELRWFALDELPPSSEVAFANTSTALDRLREHLTRER
jgi:ADP-ribose pyrophosphatase YjhB (NUDIX family)